MGKHVIMLAVCFIFYMIGNIIAITPRQKFLNAKICYEQMFEWKIIKGTDAIQPTPDDVFNTVFENFFSTYSNSNDMTEREQIFNNQFNANPEEVLNNFLDHFIEKNDYLEIIDEIRNRLYATHHGVPSPLDIFICNFSLSSRSEIYRTVKAFCREYADGGNLDGIS